jgi:hypothetical protein
MKCFLALTLSSKIGGTGLRSSPLWLWKRVGARENSVLFERESVPVLFRLTSVRGLIASVLPA